MKNSYLHSCSCGFVTNVESEYEKHICNPSTMKSEFCHPCIACRDFRRATVRANPTWEITDRLIDIDIPICIRTAHKLAIKKCENFELDDVIKEMIGGKTT